MRKNSPHIQSSALVTQLEERPRDADPTPSGFLEGPRVNTVVVLLVSGEQGVHT